MKNIPAFISILLVFTKILSAQIENSVFDHITLEDGLSHSLIHDITQDSTGFIWAATQEGLNRIDGYSIKVYRIDNESDNSLLDNWITTVTTDRSGDIWFGTRAKGFGKFLVDSLRFINYYDTLFHHYGSESGRIQELYFTDDTTLWIGTWGAGLFKFNTVTEEFIQYKHDSTKANSISEDRVYSIYQDSKDYLWCSSHRKGINRLDIKTGEFKHYRMSEDKENGLTYDFIISITEDHKGTLWFASFGGGLYRFDESQEYFHKVKLSENTDVTLITKVFEDTDNTLWVCTDGWGIYKYDRRNDKFLNLKNDPINKKTLNNDRVWSVLEDKSGIIWFGTFSGGLNLYNKRKNHFGHIYYSEDAPNSIIDNFVKGILIDSHENIWIGSNGGITIYNSRMKKIKDLTENDGLSNNRVRAIFEDKTGKYWISTWGGGVNIYDPIAKSFNYLLYSKANPNSLTYNYVAKVLQANNGEFLLATEAGLNVYDPVEKSFKQFTNIEGDTTSISSSQVTDVLIDNRGNYWVGTQYGLNLFFPETGQFKRIVSDGTNNTINNYRVSDLFQDSKGRLWIGTYGGGLNLYNYKTGTFTFITEEDGLSNNSIYEILEAKNGELWISTNKGLNVYNPETKNIRIFTSEDGIQGNEFNGGASGVSSDGRLFFGGTNGLNYFQPEEITINSNIPPVVLVEFKVNGVLRNLPGNPMSPESIELKYNENFLNFTFSALDFSSPKSNKYKYKLSGLESEWNGPSNTRSATYTNLNPGKYILEVVASNSDNVWNDEGLSFTFYIASPWWGTTLFRIIFVIFSITLVVGGYRYRIRQVKKHEILLEQIVEERTKDLTKSKKLLEEAVNSKDKLFSIIAHDLKNPFLPLLGYSELLANQFDILSKEDIVKSAGLIHESARSLYALLENLLEWARIQLDKMEFAPQEINLHKLVNEVFSIYKVNSVSKTIFLSNKVAADFYLEADLDMLKTILRNLISNSIKFCKKNDKIEISSTFVESGFKIIVTDTGIGMNEVTLEKLNRMTKEFVQTKGTDDETGTGLGLFIVKEMVFRHGGTIKFKSSAGKGTSAIIIFPKLGNSISKKNN